MTLKSTCLQHVTMTSLMMMMMDWLPYQVHTSQLHSCIHICSLIHFWAYFGHPAACWFRLLDHTIAAITAIWPRTSVRTLLSLSFQQSVLLLSFPVCTIILFTFRSHTHTKAKRKRKKRNDGFIHFVGRSIPSHHRSEWPLYCCCYLLVYHDQKSTSCSSQHTNRQNLVHDMMATREW